MSFNEPMESHIFVLKLETFWRDFRTAQLFSFRLCDCCTVFGAENHDPVYTKSTFQVHKFDFTAAHIHFKTKHFCVELHIIIIIIIIIIVQKIHYKQTTNCIEKIVHCVQAIEKQYKALILFH